MLDDVTQIHGLDKGNALGVVAGQPGQLKQAYEFDLGEVGEIHNVVVVGMGGSALAAEFVRSWLGDRLPVPIIIVRDYDLPGFVNEHSLLVASSYSGNTEETVAALAVALERRAKVVVSCSGGKLAQAATEKNLPLISIPAGYQPRLAELYGVRSLAQLLEAAGLVQGAVDELVQAADWVMQAVPQWTMGCETSKNLAKQIASEVSGHGVVIYGGPVLAAPTMNWKIDMNENAKNLAFYNYLPEFNHNEFLGWLHPQEKGMKVIELQSNLDHVEVQKRFEVSNRLLSGNLPKPIIVRVEGETKLEQMLWAFILGDFVSLYLAFLNGIDPTPVELIEKLKKELA